MASVCRAAPRPDDPAQITSPEEGEAQRGGEQGEERQPQVAAHADRVSRDQRLAVAVEMGGREPPEPGRARDAPTDPVEEIGEEHEADGEVGCRACARGELGEEERQRPGDEGTEADIQPGQEGRAGG
jgi:hypothetical protein